ncbi:MAG: hypothetical protein AB7U73_05830 [Pirellulales bacterium]
MKARPQPGFRVWLVGFEQWQPTAWYDMPPRAVAIEPADDACMSPDEATLFVQGFNETTLARHGQIWAIPVPVLVRYEHDLEPGQCLAAAAIIAGAPQPLKARLNQPTTAARGSLRRSG